MCQVSQIRDDSVVSLDVHNHLWDHGGNETGVGQEQVRKKEVHGSMKVRITGDSQDDKQVPKYSYQVHAQEQSREDGLHIWIF
jgi:hypothetical protein